MGYEIRPDSGFDDEHLFLRRIQGDERTHHLHVVAQGHPDLDDWIDFRNWLRANSDAARRYGEAKLRLAKKYYDDRGSYVDAKTAIVEELLAEARSRR